MTLLPPAPPGTVVEAVNFVGIDRPARVHAVRVPDGSIRGGAEVTTEHTAAGFPKLAERLVDALLKPGHPEAPHPGIAEAA